QGMPLGLVHRDVSPANLFVPVDGVVKLLDFGVAKSKDALARTHTGALKGKYAYMSPEQVLGKEVDRRSDVFALGTVLFELLTCRRPFWRPSEYQMFQAIVEEPMPRLASVWPDAPPQLLNLFDLTLVREADQRFASAAELGEAVDRAMDPYGGVASSRDLGEFVRREFGDMLERTRLLIEEAQARADRGDAARVVVPESQGGDPDVVIVEAPPAVVRRRSS